MPVHCPAFKSVSFLLLLWCSSSLGLVCSRLALKPIDVLEENVFRVKSYIYSDFR